MYRLNENQKDALACAVLFSVFATIMIWLVSTNEPPRLEQASPEMQLYIQENCELQGNWKQYAEGVYQRKYGNEKN